MQLDNDQLKLQYLKEFNLFTSICDEEMTQVAAATRLARRCRGEFIYLPGESSDKIYFLKTGIVKLTEIVEEGREVLLDIIDRGEIFGEIDALHGCPRAESAQVIQDALLCQIKSRDFGDLLKRYPELAQRVYGLIVLRLRKIEKRLVNLICKDVETRVKEALVDLMSEKGAEHDRYPHIRLTQQDIADLVGASRQETAKVLKRLEEDDVIRLKYCLVIVKSPDRLRAAIASSSRLTGPAQKIP
jgi:CRP/FNR family transcriptional regulator, cyclic AMP receptor protein